MPQDSPDTSEPSFFARDDLDLSPRERRWLEHVPMPASLWRRDAEGSYRLVALSRRADALTEGRFRCHLGTPVSDLYGDYENVMSAFRRCVENRATTTLSTDYRMLTSDETRPVVLHFLFLPPADVLVMLEDRSQSEARESQQAELSVKSEALESSISGIAMANLEERITYANPAFVELAGLDGVEEVLGLHPTEIAPEADEIIEALRAEGSWVGELELVRPDESRVITQVVASVTRDHEGHPIGLMGSFLDVTDRRRDQAELESQRSRLERAQQIAGLGHWEWDVASGEIHWSDQVYRIFGYEPGEVEPTYEFFLERVHPEARPRVEAAVDEALESGEDYMVEHALVHPDGSIHDVEERGRVEFGVEGKPVRMRGTVLDVTHRKRVERHLEKLQRLYATLSRVTESIVRIADENELFLEACRILTSEGGLAVAGILRVRGDECVPAASAVPPTRAASQSDRLGEEFCQAVVDTDPCRVLVDEEFLVCNDAETEQRFGSEVARRLRALGGESMALFPLRRGGEIAGMVCVGAPRKGFFGEEEIGLFRRLTDDLGFALDKRLAEARERKLQESLRRNETLATMGTLVSGVAHEVRNPLFGLSAALDAFAQEFGQEDGIDEYLGVFRSQVQRLSHLMNDLLDYGTPRSPEIERHAVRPLVDEAIERCADELEGRDLRLSDRLGEDRDVRVDRERIVRVLINLLQNAAQHTPARGEVDVVLEPRRGEGRLWIAVGVRDRGPGFRPEDLERVFEPFFSRRRDGTGLGLSIVERIVDEHGGQVRVRNREEGGSEVEVLLPARRGRAEP